MHPFLIFVFIRNFSTIFGENHEDIVQTHARLPLGVPGTFCYIATQAYLPILVRDLVLG